MKKLIFDEYSINKFQTALALCLIYGGAWALWGQNQIQLWTGFLFIYMVTGYGHFLLGFGYQAQALFKKTKEPWRNLSKIWGLSLFCTIPFGWLLFALPDRTYIVLFIIIYFLWHGALNEKTLYERANKKKFQKVFHFINGMGLLLYVNSLFHPSAIFDSDYRFDPDLSRGLIESFMTQLHIPIISQFLWMAVGLWGLILLGQTLYEKNWQGLKWLLAIAAIGLGILWKFEPINFIFLLSFILTYHFVMWWLYYARIFQKRDDQKAWYYYLGWSVFLHGGALLVLGVGYYDWFESAGVSYFYETFFTLPVFLVITFLHITTSFFNEEPIKRWLRIR